MHMQGIQTMANQRKNRNGIYEKNFDWFWYLFSFKGRLPVQSPFDKRMYRPRVLLITVLAFSLVGGIIYAHYYFHNAITTVLFVLLVIFGLWSGLAIRVKRAHDHNMSYSRYTLLKSLPLLAIPFLFIGNISKTTFTIIIMVAILFGFIIEMKMAFFRGTRGSNEYGQDPLKQEKDFYEDGTPKDRKFKYISRMKNNPYRPFGEVDDR